ncbi:hypothetical protein POM88_018117 [Heracleum sosnowskyi]|uniref:DUF6598 domain-containing protein n=1 Tax=Heracleum sosnowskyi TaxID=360622 RepID=A0AAD8IRT7_9APIA|nr:hypothetical protein POM88_018117 [Heracleum sosnowskyi]
MENSPKLSADSNALESNTDGPRGNPWTDVRCEPVIDFLHAKVFTDSLGVYGYMKIIDLQGSKNFPAYDRHQFESPQRLYPSSKLGNFLPLSGRVELQCVAFTFGVYAEVQVLLYNDMYNDSAPEGQKIDEDDDEQIGVDVYGLICARCNPMLLAKDKYENHMFNVAKEDCEWIGFGSEIVLSKSLVAVPAYSELEISLNLRDFDDDEFIVQGSVCFEPSNYYAGWKVVRGVNGYYVRVGVTWKQPSALNKHWCKDDMIQRAQQVPHCPGFLASHLLEVFSLFIARPNGKEVNMYGSVNIVCSFGWCNIFSREKDEAYLLSRGCNLLPMKGPERAATPGMTFFIVVDLRDVDGNVKIKGAAHSTVGIDERQRPWFDRRLCSVVKGEKENSFVAIHYTMFSFALQAVFKVCLVWKRRSSARVNICGDIIASYDKVSYSTIYDKQFFRRVLFTRKEANSLEVLFTGKEAEERTLILSTNQVAVPMTSSLVAEVNLSYQSAKSTHRVAEIVNFQFEESCKTIRSGDVDICIGVTWKGFPYY